MADVQDDVREQLVRDLRALAAADLLTNERALAAAWPTSTPRCIATSASRRSPNSGTVLGSTNERPPKTWLTVRTAANTQPAVGLYLRDEAGTWHAESLHVLTVTSRGIARIVAFRDPDIFAAFQLPTVKARATEIG